MNYTALLLLGHGRYF